MKHCNQHLPPMRRRTRIGAILAAALLLALAAPAVAHVVESAPFAFLSRDHFTVESPQIYFSTFKPGTILLVR